MLYACEPNASLTAWVFDAVVELRRSCVQIHVVDIVRCKTRVFDRKRHCACRFDAVFFEPDAVICITRDAVTGDLGINAGLAYYS